MISIPRRVLCVMVLIIVVAASAVAADPSQFPHNPYWNIHGAGVVGQTNYAYGHGLGLEKISSIDVGGKEMSITVEMPTDFDGGPAIITITSMTEEAEDTASNVTFLIGLFQDNEMLFRHYFFATNGVLQLNVTPTQDTEITFDAERDSVLGAWHGTERDSDGVTVIGVTGPLLDSAGLYTFEIEVRTLDDPLNIIEDSGVYYADLSMVEALSFEQKDLDGNDVQFKTKSYFDRLSSFEYDPTAKRATITMPFDWRESRMSHIPVVHTEVHIPKDFAEFFSPGYVGMANGVDLFKSSVTIDDYTEDEERIVHFVLLQDHLRLIKNEMKKSGGPLPDELVLVLEPSQEIDFPLDAYTKSEDFLINLSWEPVVVEPGLDTTFIFTIRDGRTGEPLRDSGYTFVIVQNSEEIYRSTDVARVGGGFEEFVFDEQQTGPTIIKFENIRNTGQETEFVVVVVPEFDGVTAAIVLALGAAVGASFAGARGRRRHLFIRAGRT